MRCPSRVRVSFLRITFTLLATCTAAACSGGNPEAGATGTTGVGADTPFAIEVSQTYITVENRTGVPLVGGQVDIIPAGVLQPFRSTLPRLEAGGRSNIMLNNFRGSGTPFNRAIARGKRVKVTAKDLAGNVYQHEVPFN